ncbi:MAG: MarR family transcriptional regulator [Gemmatimonadetes bacterium]|nr:MarR family transcriptional regulator [Gemmatimonadota bacterium]
MPPSDPTAESLRLWVIFSRAHAAVGARAQADVTRHGLTIAEFGVLEALHHKGPMLLSELKAKILVSNAGVTYLVDRLEKRGLVERRRCDRDRRAYYAHLTAEGTGFVARIFPEHAAAIEEAFSVLSAEERATATALLRKVGRHAADTAS